MASRLAAFWAALLLLTSLGCGPAAPAGFVKPQGKLTNAGKPLEVKPMVGLIELIFLREGGDGPVDPQIAQVAPDGSFVVNGTNGQGIPSGKYKIVVRQWEEYPNKDVLSGAFDEKSTKIVRDVTGAGEIVIDVSKPGG